MQLGTIKMNKAVIYCRVSTKEQVDEGNSLATQERQCLEYAERQKLVVVEKFIEEGESAKTTNRTELTRMCGYVSDRHNEICAVIVPKIDRLARDSNDYTTLRAYFKKCGVQVMSVGEQIDDSPTGRFIENTFANVAQLDNEIRAERSRNGMVDAATREGRWVWRAPYGYLNSSVDGKPNIVPDQTSANYVLRAFELVETGMYSVASALKILTEQGMVERSGKPFREQSIHKLLRKSVYAGDIASFGGNYPGAFASIVPKQLFDNVQLVLSGRVKKMPKYHTERADLPLRGVLLCPCGKKLTGSFSRGNGGKFGYYFCRYCGNAVFSQPVANIHAEFQAELNSFALMEGAKARLAERLALKARERWRDRARILNTVPNQIEKLKAEQKAIAKKNAMDVIPDELAKSLIADLDTQIVELNQKQKAAKSIDSNIEEAIKFGLSFLDHAGDDWEHANLKKKQRFQTFFYPVGLSVLPNGKCGTKPPLHIIEYKKELSCENSLVVDLEGVEPSSRSEQSKTLRV